MDAEKEQSKRQRKEGKSAPEVIKITASQSLRINQGELAEGGRGGGEIMKQREDAKNQRG